MPGEQRTLATGTLTQQRGVSKWRRPSVQWDHRKDKFMFLAIFSQMNVIAPDFQQLSDVLGSDIYSGDTLRCRFKELRQIAKEVMEDRQQRDTEMSITDGGLEDGVDDNETIRPGEPAIETSTPVPASQPRSVDSRLSMEDDKSITHDSPMGEVTTPTPGSKRTTSPQVSGHHAAELTPLTSNASSPVHLSGRYRAKTVPLPQKAPLPVDSARPRPHSLPQESNTQVPFRGPRQNHSKGPITPQPEKHKPNGTHQKQKRKHRRRAEDKYFIGEERSAAHRSAKPVQLAAPAVQAPQVGVMSGGLLKAVPPTGSRNMTWVRSHSGGANSGAAQNILEDFVFPTSER
ncbi:hypothetical protein BJX70DRAFT_400766 [Aspergillus crustosus]